LSNAISAMKEVVIEFKSGPVSYVINEPGYGFAVERCDDQSAIVRINGPTADPISLTEVSQMMFPTKFNKLYVTNYETIPPNTTVLLKILIIKDPNLKIDTMAPFRAGADAMTFAQLFILQASGATTRYKIWNVDASLPTPSVYTDPNQQYWPIIPLIQYIQPLQIVDGSEFTLSTTAISDVTSLVPQPQDPIPSSYFSAKDTIPLMGYSVIYTPTTTVTGTNVFLIGIQQPLSFQQLNLEYALEG